MDGVDFLRMLHAILINKAGRNISSNEVHWRQLFTASEDSLTSTILGTLLYLPRELFWKILINSCYDQEILHASTIQLIEFWPRWTIDATADGWVEPDIFIRTVDFDLIVEAKRYDYDQQRIEQWEREYCGYLNNFKEDNRRVYLLAIGGISNSDTETIKLGEQSIKVIKCRWSSLVNQIKLVRTDISIGKLCIPNSDSVLTILDDLILGFRIHGYFVGEWMEHTAFHLYRGLNKSSLTMLDGLGHEFNLVNRANPFQRIHISDTSLFFLKQLKYQ